MAGESPDPSSPTILVVDDEPSLRDALAYTLRKEGYRVVLAANGVEAIQAARRQPPQAIVLDVMLPGIDGLQVCRTLRSESTVPILLLSLRPKEFDLLHYLAQQPEVVHSRDALLRRVWGYDFPIGTRTVDVHVRWLRQKIERDPGNPTRLETVRGVGYRLVPNLP